MVVDRKIEQSEITDYRTESDDGHRAVTPFSQGEGLIGEQTSGDYAGQDDPVQGSGVQSIIAQYRFHIKVLEQVGGGQ